MIVTAALMFHTLNDRNNLISGQLDSHSSSLDTDQLVVVFNDKEYDISLETNQDGYLFTMINLILLLILLLLLFILLIVKKRNHLQSVVLKR